MEGVTVGKQLCPFSISDLGWAQPEGGTSWSEPRGPGMARLMPGILPCWAQRPCHHAYHLCSWLLEGEIGKTPLNFGPLEAASRASIESVALERLVQNGYEETGFVPTACGKLSQTLQHKEVALFIMAGSIIEELAELIDDQQQSGERSTFTHQLCSRSYEIGYTLRIEVGGSRTTLQFLQQRIDSWSAEACTLALQRCAECEEQGSAKGTVITGNWYR